MLNFWPFNRRHNLLNKSVDIPRETFEYIPIELPYPKREYRDSRGAVNTFYNMTDRQFEEAAKRIENDIAKNPNQTVKDMLEKDDVYGIEFRQREERTSRDIDDEVATRITQAKSMKLEQAIDKSLAKHYPLKDLIVASWNGKETVEVDRITEAWEPMPRVEVNLGENIVLDEAVKLSEATGVPLPSLVAAINRRLEQTQELPEDVQPDDIEDQLLSLDPEFDDLPRGVYYIKARQKFRANLKVGDKTYVRDWDTPEQAIACRIGMEMVGKKEKVKK